MIEKKAIVTPLINETNKLTIDLFHGTSTLFLDSILQNGLGGINPVNEWKLLELAKEVYTLSEQYLKETDLYKVSSYSFKKMTEQSNQGAFNFQHGDTYLSPSRFTACRYAISKEYGSEILTYTIDFLKELLKLKIPSVSKDLFQNYPKIFGLLESRPSPLLIQVSNVNTSSLLDEHGNNPKDNFKQIQESLNMEGKLFEALTQQMNFRLTQSVQTENLKFWLVNITKWNDVSPEYNLYQIKTSD